MATTDTTERGLETRIVAILTGNAAEPSPAAGDHDPPTLYTTSWIQGDPHDYDRSNCVDLVQLSAFLNATQPEVAAALSLDDDNPTRRQFLARPQDRDPK